MPAVSQAQNRLAHALAAKGVPWAVKFVREQRGKKVPRVQHVSELRGKKRGRPKMPVHAVTKDALWKRAQRADNRPPNRGMVRHHPDRSYGRRSARTEYLSRAAHNSLHHKGKVRRRRRGKVKRVA